MTLERMFETLERIREAAHVNAVFGQPEVVGEKTIIPIAQVGYGFGMGFGEEGGPAEGEPGKGGGGGGVSARPVAVLEVTPEETRLTPVVDATRMAIAGVIFSAWAFFLIARMFSKIFGQRGES
ncbi:MAG: spore germination protein GerW family protein [Anaerolineae bacterium]